MFKYSYKISTSELRDKLNLNDDEINNVLSGLTNVDSEDIVCHNSTSTNHGAIANSKPS